MKHRTALKLARNPWLAALLLVVFCARALVPVGFMPGAYGLALCHGVASAPGTLALLATSEASVAGLSGTDLFGTSSQPGGHDPARQDAGFCPFAAAATPLATAQPAAVRLPIAVIELRVDPLPAPFVRIGSIVPTRLPRGPPLPA